VTSDARDKIRELLWPSRGLEGPLRWEQKMGMIEEIIVADGFMQRYWRALRALAKGIVMNRKYVDAKDLLRMGYSAEAIDDLMAQQEDECRSTRTSAQAATDGMSTERSRRARKHQKDAVRTARRTKMASRQGDEGSQPG
jgi:hypothetical protein